MHSHLLPKQILVLVLMLSVLSTGASYASDEGSAKKSIWELEETLEAKYKEPNAADSPELAKILRQIGTYYIEHFEGYQAEPYQRKAVTILRRLADADHEQRKSLSRALEDLASTLLDEGRYADSEPLFRETLSIDESIYGTNSLDAAISMGNLARCLRYRGKFSEAESLILRSLEIKKGSKDVDEREMASTLRNLARLKGLQKKYDEAEQLYKQCIAIDQKYCKTKDERWDDLIPNQIGLANSLIGQGRYKESEDILRPIAVEFGINKRFRSNPFIVSQSILNPEDASTTIDQLLQELDAEQKTSGLSSWQATELLLKVAIKLHSLQADSAEVIEKCYDNSRSFVDTKISDASEERLAKMLVNLAFVLGAYEESDKSHKTLEAAEKLLNATKGNSNKKTDLLKSIATCWRLLGENARAQRTVEKARQLAENDEKQMFEILFLRAQLEQDLSEFKDAYDDCKAAIAIGERLFGKQSARLFAAYELLIESCLASLDATNASEFASQAAKLQGLTGGEEAKAEILQGYCLLALGKSDDEYFQTAIHYLNHLRELNEPDNLGLSSAIFNGRVECKLDRVLSGSVSADARTLSEASRDLGNALIADNMDTSSRGLLNRSRDFDNLALVSYIASQSSSRDGIPQVGRSDLELARRNAIDAAASMDRYLYTAFPELSFAQQCAFVSILKQQQNYLLTLCVDTPGSIDSAYGFMLKWKGLLLESVRSRTVQAHAASRNPQAKALLGDFQSARRSLAGLRNRLMAGDSDIAGAFAKAFERKEKLELDLIAKVAEPVNDPVANLNAVDFRKFLAPGEIFADIVLYRPLLKKEDRYAVIVSTSGEDGSSNFIDLGSKHEISDLVQKWRAITIGEASEQKREVEIRAPKISNASKLDAAQVNSGLTRLLQQMVSGSERSLDHKSPVKRIWLCSEGELARIPWNSIAVLSGEPEVVCEVDSPREFVLLHQQSKIANKSGNSVTVAGLSDFKGSKLPSLPGALKEATQLAALAEQKKMKVQSLLESKATKGEVSRALASSSSVHIATHGFARTDSDDSIQQGDDGTVSGDSSGVSKRGFRLASANGVLLQATSRNPLLDCGLYFADGARQGTSGSDKDEAMTILTADEIVGLDLSGCELVTLSACQTGLGRGVRGQGTIGLRSSILGAGAHCLLMSLWSIDDDASQELMNRFYSYLWSESDPLPPIEALMKAQSEIRGVAKWSAPRFWAGWVIAGDGWCLPKQTRR